MTPLWFKRTIVLGMTGSDVRVVRRKMGFPEDGPYDRAVQQKVIGLARKRKVDTDGEVNEEVADTLGESEANRSVTTPSWWTRPLGLWDEGDDVRSLRRILGLGDADNRYDPDLESAVKRYQSDKDLPVTGEVDVDLARVIGEE